MPALAIVVHRFGAFEFDLVTGRLFRGPAGVPLSDAQSRILASLITHAGHVVPRATLADAGWRGAAVTDSSLKQAIARLRKVIGPGVIETVAFRGYRLALRVERTERRDTAAAPSVDLAPYRAFVEGRAHLYTLNRKDIDRARAAFQEALQRDPTYAAAHVGLANALALTFEATWTDAVCDTGALVQSVRSARRGVDLAPSSGDAWSTLAFTLYLHGDLIEAAAAAHKAIALEPDDWHHWLRLAFVSWGENRIRAARSMLSFCPGLALGHWLIATVLIARGAFDAALDVLRAGCAEQDAQAATAANFPAVGLHLLRGLVLCAQQQLDEAADALTRELSFVDGGQLYARECAANTWYALGAVRLRQRRRTDADAAFASALKVAPAHLFTPAALGRPVRSLHPGDPRRTEAALAHAVGLARAGRHADAALAYRTTVVGAPVPCAGWLLPVEPVIDAGSHRDDWAEALVLVRSRAV